MWRATTRITQSTVIRARHRTVHAADCWRLNVRFAAVFEVRCQMLVPILATIDPAPQHFFESLMFPVVELLLRALANKRQMREQVRYKDPMSAGFPANIHQIPLRL